ncbi:MAG: lineage-specific thermal regulator protein [Firmicutes bacterium]|nr:lineage-specific thermal regulator protein [Bacillota bacterium]
MASLRSGPKRRKVELDRVLGRTTPVNVGQVYTALNKLEKDGLVVTEFVARDDQRAEMKVYTLAPAGAEHLHRWFTQPVETVDLRNELFIKLSLARRTGRAEVGPILTVQRLTTLRSIQELTMLKERLEGTADDDVALLIDGAILHLEADLRWLDLWEQRLKRQEGTR